jgi:GNAT superfamily N-acetyltransferase
MITTATIADLDALTDLFEGYRAFYNKPADRSGAAAFLRARIEQHESVVFMAWESEVAVGFTQLYPLFSSTRMRRLWLLNDLYVHPDHRGKGYSKQLLQRAQQHARDTDAAGVMLETAKTNEVGNQLYPKLGFEVDEDFNWYHWNNK